MPAADARISTIPRKGWHFGFKMPRLYRAVKLTAGSKYKLLVKNWLNFYNFTNQPNVECKSQISMKLTFSVHSFRKTFSHF